jgi:FkbM family methyltransferase
LTGGARPGEVLFDRGYTRLRRCRHGLMVYPLTDRFVGRSLDRYGEFSQGEADLFQQIVKPGQVVAEIGANIGAHTVALAAMVGPEGRVLALEPQRVLFQMLCANVALGGHANVHAHHAAGGREEGHIHVPGIDYAAEGNFGGVALGGYRKGARVRVARLDDLGLGACHFLKIDVEGMEGEVIAGAEETIGEFRPVLYVENDRREKSASLIEQLLGLR